MNEIHSAVPRATTRRFSFDSAAIWTLTITAAVATLAFIPAATIPFLYTKVSILAIGGLIALALYILARLTRGNAVIPPFAPLGILWLVPLAYLLSTLFSGAGFSASLFGTELEADTLGFMLLAAAFATLAALAFRRASQYRTFFMVGTIVLGITLVAQIVFVLLGHIIPNSVSATANVVGSFMDFGMLLGLGLALILLALRFLTVTRRNRTVLWVLGGVSLVMLALVNSSLIWILVALVALGLFIEAILRRRTPATLDDSDLDGVETMTTEIDAPQQSGVSAGETRTLGAPLIVLILALFFIIGGSTIGNSLASTFGTSTLDVRPSWQSTFAIGSHTYAAAPIFGSGPGTFGAQWLRFRDRSLNNTVFWNVNFTSGIGLIPTSFVTEGLVGALAWLAFLGLFVFFGLRALLLRPATDPYIRYVSVASFTGALYVFVLAVFAVPGPIVLVTGFLLAGIFVSALRYSGNRQEWGIIFSRNPRIGFVIVFGFTLLLLASVVAAYVVIERYLADHAYAKAGVALQKGDYAGAATNLNRSLVFAQTDRTYQLAALDGIAQMNKIASDSTLTPTQAQQQFQSALSTSVQAATTATKLGPNNYQNWLVLGQVYQTVVPLNIDGAYANAKAAYQHAAQLSPTDPTIPFTLAQLEIAQKDYKDAETDLNQAISLKSDYTQAIFLLSQLEVQMGNSKQALQAAEAAAYFAPNDPTVLFQVGILRSANGDTNGAVQALAQAVQLNPQYANARFFLAVTYAQQSNFAEALKQLQAIAALSADNAKAVAADIAALQAGKNPFPASQLGALGIPQPQVTDTTAASSTTARAATTSR